MSKVELKDVSYRYVTPHVTVDAVKQVSYTFAEACFYALCGSSGSGKTTLMSLLAGLDLPTEGDVLFDGVSTKKLNLNKHRQEHVATIYQSLNLLPQLTVAENICFPMEQNKVKPKAAMQKAWILAEQVGLTKEEFHRYPAMLSGGQQQRVAIARALGTPAKIILADEPTGNLDSVNTENVISLLLKLAHEKQYCVIVVTHDKTVSDLADVVLEMKDGQLEKAAG